MKILNHSQIKRKVSRLALEILENNFDTSEIYLGGINKNGQRFAALLLTELAKHSKIEFINFQIKLSPAAPLSTSIDYSIDVDRLNGQHVIIVDDVANTGRTLFYAAKPLMNVVPKNLEMVVLVDRKHKSFPVHVDYVGLSLATTFGEQISVMLERASDYQAELA